jgi:phosphopantothenoylcysteine decarboxylase
LAKLAGGLCDNLATSLLRALPPISVATSATPDEALNSMSSHGDPYPSKRSMQVWVFPAMNTMMYGHPLTAEHLRVVTEVLKYRVEGPIGGAAFLLLV